MLNAVLSVCSCSSNVATLEVLIRDVPGCGNVITFFQFLFIAIEGFIFTSKFGTVKPAIPIKSYFVLVSMFFATSFSNNFALNFDISMPLHMILKSGSLVTNMVLGMLILNKRYTLRRYISVFMVTCGIILFTWASEGVKAPHNQKKSSSLVGILLLVFALVVSASLGIYQETLFKKYGKHPREALFFSHALPLPGFLFLAKDIYSKLPLFSLSEPVRVFSLFSIPHLWLYLLGNVLMQYICIRSVFMMASTYSSLASTMVLTFRKFISLMISVLYFQNVFSVSHWLGATLVFTGSLLFMDFKGFKRKTQ